MVDVEESDNFHSLFRDKVDVNNPELIDLCRCYCYGFRSGGYVDSTIQSISNLILTKKNYSENTIYYLNNALNSLAEIVGLRSECIPRNKYVFRRLAHYYDLFKNVLLNLSQNLRSKLIKKIYLTFKKITELVTGSNGLYIMNWEDSFLLENDGIYLKDQGINIFQGLFSDDFSFNYALIDPGSEFYHLHHDLCEYHFIDGYENGWLYEHYQNGKSFKIQGNDIIAMQPNVLHGGINPPNSKPVMLGFVAGSSKSGPWRFDFNDRDSPPPKGMKKVKTISLLNGIQLDDHIDNINKKSNGTVLKELQFPNQQCGLGLNLIGIKKSNYTFNSDQDSILKVLKGSGKISLSQKITSDIHPNYSFVIPAGIIGEILSDNMILMNFT